MLCSTSPGVKIVITTHLVLSIHKEAGAACCRVEKPVETVFPVRNVYPLPILINLHCTVSWRVLSCILQDSDLETSL